MPILVLLLVAFGPMNRLGIISAIDEELRLIKQDMQIEAADTIAQRIFTIGKIQGLDCICVKAGIGKVNAAMTAEILLMQYNVDAVVYSGVAGGINPALGIGDIVISKNVLHHDFGQLTPEQFILFDTLGFLADSSLISIAIEAGNSVQFDEIPQKICKETDRLPHITIGRIATGDQFITSEEKRQWLEKKLGADCVDMESAAVAQVCMINEIPFVIIRCLSDLANEKADIDFMAFLPYAAKNSSLLVREMIKLLGEK